MDVAVYRRNRCQPSNTWDRAEAEAVALGGHLVTINDEAENQWVLDTFGPQASINGMLWIGFTDQQVEGEWSLIPAGITSVHPIIGKLEGFIYYTNGNRKIIQ
jgi:hypothetical protein